MITLGNLLLIFVIVFMLIPGAVAVVYFIVTVHQQGNLLPPKRRVAMGWRRARGKQQWHYIEQCDYWPMTDYEEIAFITQLTPEPLCVMCGIIEGKFFPPDESVQP